MPETIRELLTRNLTDQQIEAVTSNTRRLLVIAGAGSGKTEVMSRRVGWWIGIEGIPKENVVAFTFTDAAAEELKFRIRQHIEKITLPGEDPTLGGMYVGTIHGFCIKLLRELAPDVYYNYDVLDDAGRIALIERGYHNVLGLNGYQTASGLGKYQAIDKFLTGYDLLNEYDLLDIQLSGQPMPTDVAQERDWCREATLLTDVGDSAEAKAFAESAARFYAYLRSRRFLDFSTSQSELTRLFRNQPGTVETVRASRTHIVVDEVQDVNPVQDEIIRQLIGPGGRLTAVGDHRQAIYAFRGGRVELMGRLHDEFVAADDGRIVELPSNFRSTPAIIEMANHWSDSIGGVGGLPNPHMTHGRESRVDFSPSHVGAFQFGARDDEADWIASTILDLVRPDGEGARHDVKRPDGMIDFRGMTFGDVAVLLRSATDVRTYFEALRQHGIPAVVRGAGLFSQGEILLFLGVLAKAAGLDAFFGSPRPDSLPSRIQAILGCRPEPEEVIRAGCRYVSEQGLPVENDCVERLLLLADAIHHRIEVGGAQPFPTNRLKSIEAAGWVGRENTPRRVFPQQLFHWILEEAGVAAWDSAGDRGRTAMFHLGQLSSLITSIETPGWTTARDLRYQIIALCMWGSGKARAAEAPLLVAPDAVTITTVHSAKGLEFSAIFLADVNSRRFPSNRATTRKELPFDGAILQQINPADLADNPNKDGERRLMYVALTRAERYLFLTCSTTNRQFIDPLRAIIRSVGGTAATRAEELGCDLAYTQQEYSQEQKLSTSFSDLRYYLECPHDFYLRKILGFAPTIDQAFGYGRGVHNLLREVHQNPREWAILSERPEELRQALQRLVESGLFYLRYTTDKPLENMRRTALNGLSQYVEMYGDELARLEFIPEQEFETLLPEQQVLISGAIDLVRLDDPPRVTIIDFKSGERGEESQSGFNDEMMRLQIGIYGLAAKHELEYEPDRGLLRYIGEDDPAKRETAVELSDAQLSGVRARILEAAGAIRSRRFNIGPTNFVPDRCGTCDLRRVCGRKETTTARQDRAASGRKRR